MITLSDMCDGGQIAPGAPPCIDMVWGDCYTRRDLNNHMDKRYI